MRTAAGWLTYGSLARDSQTNIEVYIMIFIGADIPPIGCHGGLSIINVAFLTSVGK